MSNAKTRARSEIDAALRRLVVRRDDAFCDAAQYDETVRRYGDELMRLYAVYAAHARASPLEHTLGVVHYMLHGLTVRGVCVARRDELLQRTVPRASALQSVAGIAPKAHTRGVKYIERVFASVEAAAGAGVPPNMVVFGSSAASAENDAAAPTHTIFDADLAKQKEQRARARARVRARPFVYFPIPVHEETT
jgi:hypothetical protein